MDSVFIRPDSTQGDPWVNRTLTEVIPNIITYSLTAYNNNQSVPQSLTIGATSNVVLEARANVDLYLSPQGALRMFETSVYPNTSIRTDTQFLSISRDGNSTVITTTPTVTFPTACNISLSHLALATQSNQQVLSTTEPFGFLVDNNIQVNGNAFINDHLVAVGNIYGNNLNMFRTYEDPNHDRIGFAFNINDEEQLELIKYSRYFDTDTRQHVVVTRKVVTFGGKPTYMTDPSDVIYDAFSLLDGAPVPTNSINTTNNVTFSGIGTGSVRPVVDTAARGFNMQLDGNTRFSGDIIPTYPSMYDIGASNLRLRSLYASSFDVINDAYYKGQPLVSSQWTSVSSNIHFPTSGIPGNVGIGTDDPLYRLTVNGEIASSGDHIAYSDARFKTQLEKIPTALQKLHKISGYTFRKVASSSNSISNRRHTGVVAQEVLKVLPEAVYEDSQGYMSVAYGNMMGLVIEAIKELDTKLEKFL
jgi:hypothetical protein